MKNNGKEREKQRKLREENRTRKKQPKLQKTIMSESVRPNAKDDETADENEIAFGADDDGLLDTCVEDREVGFIAITANKGPVLVGEEPAEAP